MNRIAVGLAATLLMSSAGCTKPVEADQSLAAPVAAVPPDRSKGPITATISADRGTIAISVPERTVELSVMDVFGTQKTKFDQAVIVAQSQQGDRYDVLLRVDAPSDPKQDGGRCANGREVSMQHIAFDTGSTRVASYNDLESCVQRLRVAAERREPDGRLEFDLKKMQGDDHESDIYLRYDLTQFEKSIGF